MPEVWFCLEVPLNAPQPRDVWTVNAVAQITGRTPSAIRRAMSQNRVRSIRLDARRQRATTAGATRYVHATPQELETWRVREVAEVLGEHPSLPQDPSGWISEAALARKLEAPQHVARRVIRRLNPPRLEWSASPWQTEVRFCIPRVPVPNESPT